MVKYDNFGRSSSITKLYAIKERRHTIVIVSFDSSSLGCIQNTDQQINRIKIIGKITLKI